MYVGTDWGTCGAVLENVVFEEHYRDVDYTDKSVTGKDLDSHVPTSCGNLGR